MKKTNLIIVVLALLSIIDSNAQNKEYQIEPDGYEWYEIESAKGKYGAEDKYGNLLIPAVYDMICYHDDDDRIATGFVARKGDYYGWYNRSGRCIIPYTRQYTSIHKRNN